MVLQNDETMKPYEALWSDLKSMRYALKRAMNVEQLGHLGELDRSRLKDLAAFLRREFVPEAAAGGFRSLAVSEPHCSMGMNLQQMVMQLDVFKGWRQPSKMGVKEKMLKLVTSVEDYESKWPENLVPEPPPAEFKVLDGILSELLLRTEMELVA